ncbi:MAG: ABC transporter ATP-binding protein, partial [Casimicrobiaceae bacterium]
ASAASGALRSGSGTGNATAAAAKLSFRDKQELEKLPARIDGIEAQVAGLQQQLADPTLYQRDADEARAVAQALKEAEDELKAAYARWETLEARR